MENQAIVTILTPTYNRAHQLPALYKSLCMQSNKCFVWCVVDDGSADNTVEVVNEMIKTASFPIVFINKKNGGKHTALNAGLKNIDTPLVFIVDSDDTVTPDAVEVISKYLVSYADDEDICGFSFLRAFPDGKINGNLFSQDELVTTYINARINSNDMLSDKAEVYKTKCLHEFTFPEYENEKFLGEDIVWIRMARKYKMLHVNRAIYVGEYQTDGLTKNRRFHNLHSPKGCTERAKEYLYKDICIKMRIKGYFQYLIYGKFSGYTVNELFKSAPNKFMCLFFYVPAMLIKFKWGRALKKEKKRDLIEKNRNNYRSGL